MSDEKNIHDIETLYQSCASCLKMHTQNPLHCEPPCFSLLTHALSTDSDPPWTYFYLAFEDWVTSRVRSYCFRYRLSDTLVDHFVNITYFRYWQSLHGKPQKLKDFQHALNYLRVCARSTVLDSTKNSTETVEQELDTERLVAPSQHRDDFEKLWQIVLEEIEDERERLLIHCYIVEDLKPKDILEAYPGQWEDAEEIKVMWQRVRRQLRRSYPIRRWFDVDDTI